jgi:hypothetical protein
MWLSFLLLQLPLVILVVVLIVKDSAAHCNVVFFPIAVDSEAAAVGNKTALQRAAESLIISTCTPENG